MKTSNSVTTTIETLIAKFAPPEYQNVALMPATHLVDELGIDSARMVDIVLDVEDTFHITIEDQEINRTRTFGDLVELVQSKTQSDGATA